MKGLLPLVGLEKRPPQWRDSTLSALGAAISILALFALTNAVTPDSALLVVASMGASAVLLFAVPHGPLSQPWHLVMGHVSAAVIGVACQRLFADTALAAAVAVGFAVLVMRVTSSIHPPGGATALTAVIGGPDVVQLGYHYVLTPVLFNVVALLAIAIAFNYAFGWRRYPAHLSASPISDRPDSPIELTHADLVYALSEMDTFLDVSEQDLLRLYDLAIQHHNDQEHWQPPPLLPGRAYSNGRYGSDWQVREILAIDTLGADGRHVVTFRVVAGQGRRHVAKSGLLEFRRWARYLVQRNENSWQRIAVEPDRTMGRRECIARSPRARS